MSPDLDLVVAAVGQLSDGDLAALIDATNGVPQIAPRLLAWVEHVCDWELNRRGALDFPRQPPDAAIPPEEDGVSICRRRDHQGAVTPRRHGNTQIDCRHGRRHPIYHWCVTTADRHEERAQKVADALRAVLLALSTSGVAASYALAGRITSKWLWLAAMAVFVVSLGCILASWFFAKHRALKRRDAAPAQKTSLEFKWWQKSWWWDMASAVAIVLGAFLLGVGLALA